MEYVFCIGIREDGSRGEKPPITFTDDEAQAKAIVDATGVAEGHSTYMVKVPKWPKIRKDGD